MGYSVFFVDCTIDGCKLAPVSETEHVIVPQQIVEGFTRREDGIAASPRALGRHARLQGMAFEYGVRTDQVRHPASSLL